MILFPKDYAVTSEKIVLLESPTLSPRKLPSLLPVPPFSDNLEFFFPSPEMEMTSARVSLRSFSWRDVIPHLFFLLPENCILVAKDQSPPAFFEVPKPIFYSQKGSSPYHFTGTLLHLGFLSI